MVFYLFYQIDKKYNTIKIMKNQKNIFYKKSTFSHKSSVDKKWLI